MVIYKGVLWVIKVKQQSCKKKQAKTNFHAKGRRIIDFFPPLCRLAGRWPSITVTPTFDVVVTPYCQQRGMQRHVCLCARRRLCVFRTTGRNSRWAPGCCSWPRLSCCCSTAARSAAAGRSLGSTCRSERTCWCCSCRCWPTDTSHHMTRCSPAGCSHGNWARMTLVHILISVLLPVSNNIHRTQRISHLSRRPTYRPVTATVVLPDRHPHCHLLTRLPVFFACMCEDRLNKMKQR